MFVRNCWYVIAWDHEVAQDALFSRTVLNEPILLFRSGNEIVAMEDRCCHRLAPLSRGRKEGDCVRCGYHGLKFNAQGQCIEVPGSERVPEQLRVRTYPVEVKHQWVFVWMGDPARADRSLLPDNFSNDDPAWVNRPGYLHYDVPYLLICDNLLDFSHLSYVHESTLGGSTKIAQARPKIERVTHTDGTAIGVKVSRLVEGVPPSPYWRTFRPQISELVDRWFVYDFLLPGTLLMSSGGRGVGRAGDDEERSVHLHSCQTLTPETDTTTHYFFQQSCKRDYLASAPDAPDRMFEMLVQAFNEDRDMITAQYESIKAAPEVAMMPVALDAALGRFRSIVEQRAAAESRGSNAPAAS